MRERGGGKQAATRRSILKQPHRCRRMSQALATVAAAVPTRNITDDIHHVAGLLQIAKLLLLLYHISIPTATTITVIAARN